MMYMKPIFLVLSLTALLACDPKDDPTIPDNSCTVIPGLPASGEFYLLCPDGSKVLLKTTRDGDDGQSCMVVDNDNGTSSISCPDGTSSTFPNENRPATGECEGLQTLDPVLGFCIPWVEVQFTGTISLSNIAELPDALKPLTTTTCEGTIAFPAGLSPVSFGSTGDGFVDGTYVFGHNALYGLVMTVDNVTYSRDGRFSVPDSVNYTTQYEATTGDSGTLTISSTTNILSGFSSLSASSLNLAATKTLGAGQDFSMSLPTSVSEWSSMENPQITMNYDDYNGSIPRSAFITCDVTQFTDI